MTKKKRENKIQKEINASVRTGTKKREKKKNWSPDVLFRNRLIRNTPSGTMKEKIIYIKNGITYGHEFTKDLILNNTTEEITLELNEKSLKRQRKRIKALGLVLNRLNLPTDLSEIIISKSLNEIYIEKDIFKVLTPQMINIFYKKGEDDEIIEENELYFLMKEYMKNDHIYGFLKSVMINELRPLGWQKVLPAELPRKTLITISTRRRLTYNHHYYTNYDGYIIDQFN